MQRRQLRQEHAKPHPVILSAAKDLRGYFYRYVEPSAPASTTFNRVPTHLLEILRYAQDDRGE